MECVDLDEAAGQNNSGPGTYVRGPLPVHCWDWTEAFALWANARAHGGVPSTGSYLSRGRKGLRPQSPHVGYYCNNQYSFAGSTSFPVCFQPTPPRRSRQGRPLNCRNINSIAYRHIEGSHGAADGTARIRKRRRLSGASRIRRTDGRSIGAHRIAGLEPALAGR